jgi:hypothetical protein
MKFSHCLAPYMNVPPGQQTFTAPKTNERGEHVAAQGVFVQRQFRLASDVFAS